MKKISCAIVAFLVGIYLFAPLLSMFSKDVFSANAEPMNGQAECVMEINSGRVLFASNCDLRLPMASTTKIITALTVLEACDDLKTAYTIPVEAEGVEGSSVYLKSGEVYTIEDLLYGLMLRSGNDCATALALYCSGNLQDFSTKMNQFAEKAGAINSCFKNPHGLPQDGHYTTAYDLSLIACYGMKNAIFQRIVATKYYQPRHWTNKNKMLQQYDGANGIKTGYTKQAGRCLVSSATKDEMTLVCTVLNCPMMYERSSQLLDDAFAMYRKVRLISEGEKIVVPFEGKEVVGVAHDNFDYPLLKEEEELIEIKAYPYKKEWLRKKKREEIVGQFEIYLSKRLLFSGNLYKL